MDHEKSETACDGEKYPQSSENQSGAPPEDIQPSSIQVEDEKHANEQQESDVVGSESLPISRKFEVDVNQIETVTVADQDAEIQSLGLTVYNQSTLERGIWEQVEKETRKREAQEELANVSTKLKLAEEQLKRVESAKGVKRSILQSALEEPPKKKVNSSTVNKHKDLTQEKVKELRLKKEKLQAQLNSKNLSKHADFSQESERDRKIRMGEMTPFGSTLSAPSSDMSSFEKYLKSQQELHKKMMSNIASRKKVKTKDVKEKTNETVEHSSSKKQQSNKKILKQSVLFPKKRPFKEKLGTSTSFRETDQNVKPGNVPAEKSVIDLEETGSEYVPSDDDTDFDPESPQKSKSASSYRSRSKKTHSPGSAKKTSESERWAGGSLSRRKRKVKAVPDGDPEEWGSDDSDWICTDDEEFSSDNEARRKLKQSSKGGKRDDGNNEDFFRRIKQWERLNEGLREQMEEDVHEFENGYRLPNIIWEKLYIYQQVGVRWMWELNQQKCGGILGDEMGLGKTIQIISFLAGLSISKLKCRVTGYRGLGPTLIVCPTTVMHQWLSEFHTWFPPLRVAILHESGAYIGKRSQLIRDMLHEKGIIITSYTAVVRLKDHLLHQRWHYVILDEGHKIRNPDAQVTLAVKQLRTPHRLVLSGSPLQNHLRELWSLMDFVFPGKLGTLPVFMSEFAVPINQGGYSNASEVMVATAFKCATVLRDTISPYLLRRMKADVSEHIKLPTKNEQVLFCRLTDEQRDLYKAYLQCGEVGRILEGRCQIFVGLINLRKICNHPHLYSGGPKLFAQEKEEDLAEEERFGYWEKAGKMVVIEALLKMWSKQEHRVLIFTQSRQMLLIMEKFVNERGYRYLKMDGSTSISARQPLINKFNEDKSYFVMLLTTKVGGLGVNLTGANRVVIYDPDWNPATDTQARERAWRIGQQNAVTVYRLITAGTIEEKMYHRQIFKQFLCNKVLKDPRQRRFFKSNDLLELFTLKETDDGSTETSAIFAGTNSQVQVKPKSGSQKDKKHNYHRESYQKTEAHANSSKSVKLSKPDKSSKISFSKDKMNHMKKLAHELSLKFSSKVAAQVKENVKTDKHEDDLVEVGKMGDTASTSDKPKDVRIETVDAKINLCTTEESPRNSSRHVIDEIPERSGRCVDLDESVLPVEVPDTGDITADYSDDDLEEMRQIAMELSKELSHKVQAAAAANKPKMLGITPLSDISKPGSSGLSDKSAEDDSFEMHQDNIKTQDNTNGEKNNQQSSASLEEGAACSEVTVSKTQNIVPGAVDNTVVLHHGLTSHTHRERTCKNKEGERKEDAPSSSKHKKSKKHKKHKHRDAVFEGERVPGLVKSSNLADRSKEEMEEEASHSKKQDDYVLRKLFSKTGIKTAMQHERIMESGHADYALVEGEARRVAEEAVRAMKASRRNCWNAMSGQPTWTGTSGRVRTTEERESRSNQNATQQTMNPQNSRPKFGKRKKPITPKSGSQGSADKVAEEESGSSSLLARIRARNLLLTEKDDDNTIPDAPAIVPDSNQELLDDIRTFVSFGASVDGRATTDEIVSKFQSRLPAQSTALFKQMLMQICEFHRLPSGQGVWKLIPDFHW